MRPCALVIALLPFVLSFQRLVLYLHFPFPPPSLLSSFITSLALVDALSFAMASYILPLISHDHHHYYTHPLRIFMIFLSHIVLPSRAHSSSQYRIIGLS